MVNDETNYLDIVLLGKEYRVACPPEERQALRAAADHVAATMNEISEKTRNNSAERVAVMAALNIAHELLAEQASEQHEDDLETALDIAQTKRRIQDMETQIDAALAPQETLF